MAVESQDVIIAGIESDQATGTSRPLIMRFSTASQSPVWSKIYDFTGMGTAIYDLEVLANGDILLTGSQTPSGDTKSKPYAMRVTSAGQPLWKTGMGPIDKYAYARAIQ